MESKPLIFGYWKVRAKGHILRMILQYLHLPYQQVIYSSPQSFFNERKEIAHLAQNLPYIQDGETVVFDLMPTIIYITGKYGRQDLLGKTIKDKAIVDMYSWDVQYLMKKVLCSNNFERLNEEQKKALQLKFLKENIEPMLSQFQSFISQTSGWYLDYLSILDFSIHQLKTYIDLLFPEKMKSYPKMSRVAENLMKIPEVRQLQNQERIKELCFLPYQMCKKFKKQCS